MHAEKISVIGPTAARHPARRAGEFLKLADRIFVRVFGMAGFAGLKPEPAAPDTCCLTLDTDNVHFSTALAGIIYRFVAEATEIDLRARG